MSKHEAVVSRAYEMRTDAQRVDDIRKLSALILTDISPRTPEALAKKPATTRDAITRDAMIQHLSIIGVAASGLTRAFRAKYPLVSWRQVIAMRHFLGKPDRLLNFEAVWRSRWHTVPALIKNLISGPAATVTAKKKKKRNGATHRDPRRTKVKP